MTDNTSTALITGGTSGTGLATAKKLAQLGIHVLVVGRNAERGKRALEEIRTAGGKADFISSELLGADSAHEVARKAIELGSGHVDILINNAGIYPFGPTHEMTEEQFLPASGCPGAVGQVRTSFPASTGGIVSSCR